MLSSETASFFCLFFCITGILSRVPSLDDGAVPVLGRGHDGNGPHAAEVGAGHSGGGRRGLQGLTRRALVLFSGRDLVVLGLHGVLGFQCVLVQVGWRHGPQGRALAAHLAEGARARNAALRWGDVLSGRKHRQNISWRLQVRQN